MTTHALGLLTDRLNEAFADVEDALDQLRLGVSASVSLGDGVHLSYKKHDNRWSLLVLADGSTTPICKASRQLRVLAASVIDELHAVLLETADSEAQAVLASIDKLRRSAERIRVSAALRPPEPAQVSQEAT
jgi:hypothetical protein